MTHILADSIFIYLQRRLLYSIRLFKSSRKLKQLTKCGDRKNESTIGYELDNNKEREKTAEKALHAYGNSLLRLAYSYLHNMSDAEDILQETLIQLIANSPTFESCEHEKAWLMRVAINLSKNRIKYLKKRETYELNDDIIGTNSTDLSFVWEAVNNLPIKYREIIHLYYHEEYSTLEISKLLGKNDSTVRSLLSRGRTQLKNILKEAYGYEG